LVGTTVKAATQIAAGQAATGIVSSQVAALMEGVVRAMFLNKLKAIGVISALVAIMGLGAGSLRLAEAADGNGEKTSQSQNSGPRALAPPAAAARDRAFQISLQVAEVKDGKSKQIALPRITTTNNKEASYLVGGDNAITINNKVRFITTGITVRALVTADPTGNPELDMTVTLTSPEIGNVNNGAVATSESARLIQGISLDKPVSVELKPKEKGGRTIRVTATVKEVTTENTLDTLAAAERDFKVAEFYRRAGKSEAAQFVFELIRRRYPDTLYARLSYEHIAAIKLDKQVQPPESKEPYRVGEVRIINNSGVPDSAILDKVGFHPGELFTMQRLLKGEWKLLESGLFVTPPKISFTYEKSDSDFKDITIKIEE